MSNESSCTRSKRCLKKYGFLERASASDANSSPTPPYTHFFRDEGAFPGTTTQSAINNRFVQVPKVVAKEEALVLRSRYGYFWRGIDRPHDRELAIAGSEIVVVDLKTNEILAVRRGFIRTGKSRGSPGGIWWANGLTCPNLPRSDARDFIYSVLKPVDLNSRFHPELQGK